MMKHQGWSIKHSLMTTCETSKNANVKQRNLTISSVSEKAKFNKGRIDSDISAIKPRDAEGTIPRYNWHVLVN